MGSPDDETAPLPGPSNYLAEEGDLHTPTPLSPPRSKTPPTITGKRGHSRAPSASTNAIHRSGSAPVNPTALKSALLKQVEDVGRRRDITPAGSPQRKRQKTFAGDHRFIPNRSGQDLQASYSLLDDEGSPGGPALIDLG
jgi:cell division cycle 20-like protein 1 (cofactor of APC complex)